MFVTGECPGLGTSLRRELTVTTSFLIEYTVQKESGSCDDGERWKRNQDNFSQRGCYTGLQVAYLPSGGRSAVFLLWTLDAA